MEIRLPDVVNARPCGRFNPFGFRHARRPARVKHRSRCAGRASAAFCLLVLVLLLYPLSASSFADTYTVSLDMDDADGNQAVSSLDVSAGGLVAVQIFGTGIQDAILFKAHFEYDPIQVVYEGFDAGSAALFDAGVNAEWDSGRVWVALSAAPGRVVLMEPGLIGTVRFRVTQAFSEAEIRLFRTELLRRGRLEVLVPALSVALHRAAPPSADFDGSGLVGFADFILFAGAFGREMGSGNYEAKYDLNGDGHVGFGDFVIFAGSFGKEVNRAPNFALASPVTLSVPENTPAGRPVSGPVSARDPDGDTLTYSLLGADAGHFAIDAATGQIRTKEGIFYDHEARERFSLNVRASDGRGGRAYIGVGIAVTDVDEPPSAPRAIVAARPGYRSLTILWEAVPGEAGKPPVIGYEVTYRRSDNANWTPGPITEDSADTSVVLTGLTNEKAYYVRVRALSDEGAGDWSPPAEGTPLATGEIAFPDSGLRSVLAAALGKEGSQSPIYAEEMASLTVLATGLGDPKIANLEGLQYAVNLKSLHLGYNRISDISPLSGLTGLRILWINGNPISDASGGISALTGLTALEDLHLQSTGVTDFSALASLTNLKRLYLGFADHASAVTHLSGLVHLEILFFIGSGLSDISPLASLANLRELDVASNFITDLSPLAGLTRLDIVNLRHNKIAEISPLVANAGLTGAGDRIDLKGNPLNETSIREHIPELQARRVRILYDEVLITVNSEPQVYNDNVFVVPVSGVDLRTSASFTGDRLREVVNDFYGGFRDEFDFLILIVNLRAGEGQYPFLGANYPISNRVRGIGLQLHSDEERDFGSNGMLKGVLFLKERDGIRNGPMLHELMHQWAAYVVVTGFGGHWGFSSANGQLGGFAAEDLVELGNGRYTAGHVVTAGYADNTVTYSPIELYLAGFLAADRVPDLLVAEGASWLQQDGRPVLENGLPVFTATGIRTYTIEDVVREYGVRNPGLTESQKVFRAAAIFLIDQDHPATREQLDAVSADVSWISMEAEDGDERTYNFHEATRGVATIRMDGLGGRRK